eukprot:4629516-Pyramimonas_sp.AAC.1
MIGVMWEVAHECGARNAFVARRMSQGDALYMPMGNDAPVRLPSFISHCSDAVCLTRKRIRRCIFYWSVML